MKCHTCGKDVKHLASHAMQYHASYNAPQSEIRTAIDFAYGRATPNPPERRITGERRLPVNRQINPVGTSHWLLDRRSNKPNDRRTGSERRGS